MEENKSEQNKKPLQCCNCDKFLSSQYPYETCDVCNEPMCRSCWFEMTCCDNCMDNMLSED